MNNLNINKYLVAILLSILLPVSGIIAQTQIDDNSGYNSIFWEISGNNLEKKSYLFGTIHLIPESEYKFENVVKDKFDSCKTLVLEADINMSLKQQIEIAKKIILPGGKKLEDFMTLDQFANFQSYLIDSLGIGKSTFKKIRLLKPIFSSALILNELIEKPISIETEFSKEAKKRKMEVVGLETIEFQMSLIDTISIEKQVEMLLEDDTYSNPIKEYNRMLDAYKQQNLARLFSFAKDDDDFKYFEDDFLINRNIKWVSAIKKIITGQSSFIAVGAAHLYGEDGLVALMRKEGYIVKAIK